MLWVEDERKLQTMSLREAPTLNATISLLDFANSSASEEATILFVVSTGYPDGQEVIFDPDPYYGLQVYMLEGTVDADGIWRWDRRGKPRDFYNNAITRVDAWHTKSDN